MLNEIVTDYLVIGAGVAGLCFVDELVTRSDATVTVVDERGAPGGHWNDVYPFVKLHQPSTLYGVESTDLGSYRIDVEGPNKGFLSLAEGPEIVAYLHAVMRDRLLPSGRVRYLPFTRHEGDGNLCNLLSGRRDTVRVARKLVDASYYTNSIPLTHKRAFAVEPSVLCVPPNDLPRLAAGRRHFTVLGNGKTGMDVCLWLLARGVDPKRIRWVSPREQWFVNRARVQPGAEFFEEVFAGFAASRDDIATATDAADLAARHERSGTWLRLAPDVSPTAFHAAHMSEGELVELRRIHDVVRLGYVVGILPDAITLTGGSVSAETGTLYVDCTASALKPRPLLPVFDGDRITVQMIRAPQIPFSAALIAFLEASCADDADKNRFAAPIPLVHDVEGYIRSLRPDFDNRLRVNRDARVAAWSRASRLDGFSRIAAEVGADEPAKLAILKRVAASTKAAVANLPKLEASLVDLDH